MGRCRDPRHVCIYTLVTLRRDEKALLPSLEYTPPSCVSTGSLTLTLRRSPLPDVDDNLSTLLPTSERFSELGIATTTDDDDQAAAALPPPPLIQILRRHLRHRLCRQPRPTTVADDDLRRMNRTTAEVYSTARRRRRRRHRKQSAVTSSWPKHRYVGSGDIASSEDWLCMRVKQRRTDGRLRLRAFV